MFFQAQVAGRQPGRIGRVIGGDRVDRQHQRCGVDTYLFAGPGGIEFLLGIILCSRGAERQRRDVEVAALLRVDRIAHFDHPVAHTVDILLEGARFTQRLDLGVVDLQRAQAAVIVQRHRVIDAQGQYRLGLHIDFGLIEAGIDEHRTVILAAGLLREDLQADRLAAQLAQLQRRNFHTAALARQQGDDPAGAGSVLVVEAVQAVDLAGVTDFEIGLQRAQVRFAELGYVAGLQGQLKGFARVEACAIDAGEQRRGLHLQAE
ncbi:hypothetical protein D3C77_326530 [compost metagenome]